ncbi:MAG: FeoA family protein [Terracidiphilus sp.]|nr:FeoA family protein [Terracidiphilus sp.]
MSDLKVGSCGILVGLDLPESVQNHLMHMGFVPAARITVLRRAPAGDPTVYGVDGMEIALRHETASAIRMRACCEQDDERNQRTPQADDDPQGIPEEDVTELVEAGPFKAKTFEARR